MKPVPYLIIAVTVVNCAAAAIVLTQLSTAPAQATAPAAPAPVIRTERIELVDKAGQVRGQFFVEENGEAVFRMRDQQGQIRVKLGASERGAGLVLMDDRTEPGVQIRAGTSALTRQRNTGVTISDGQTTRNLSPAS